MCAKDTAITVQHVYLCDDLWHWFSVFWEVEFTNLPFNFFGESASQALVFGSHGVLFVCICILAIAVSIY